MEERLQKLLARAGVASRRGAEAMIESGSVRVNGRLVTRLGSKADPAHDTVTVDGKRLRFPSEVVYYLFNKPRSVVCTASDPNRRRTIFSLLKRLPVRVFPVGRLAYDSEGLLILTSDGDFANKISRGQLRQAFSVKIKGRLTDPERDQLVKQAGRYQADPLRLRLIRRGPNPWYEAQVTRPQSDWLRTLFFRLGHPVEKMNRVSIGTVRDADLRPGQYRELTRGERDRLLRDAKETPDKRTKRAGGAVRATRTTLTKRTKQVKRATRTKRPTARKKIR